MVSRRKFILQGGMAVSAASLLSVIPPGYAKAASSSFAAISPLYKVVVDNSFAESAAFAAETRRRGIPIEIIHGDLTRFWYADLEPRWKTGPVAVGGLTSIESVHCLELLARRHGARIIYRAEHHCLKSGVVDHVLYGSSTSYSNVSSLRTAGVAWAAEAATLMTDCTHDFSPTVNHQASVATAHAYADERLLVSWVIAPVRTT
ncbi:MAG: hypothetical protein AB7I12_04170 [Steroidobacteraceae bacterium]